jgi:hypothetical protein
MPLTATSPRAHSGPRLSHPLSEAKPQVWRALACLDDGSERLLCLGRSTVQVRDGYQAALGDLLDAGERRRVRRVTLQRWHGAPDLGRWADDSPLPLPLPAHRHAA